MIMPTVITCDTLEICNITKRRAYKISQHSILTPLHYKSERLLVQTPESVFLSRPIKECNHFLKTCLFFPYFKFDPRVVAFHDKILQIEGYIRDSFPVGRRFASNIKYNLTKTSFYFNLNIQVQNSNAILSIFDKHKSLKDIKYITPAARAKNIIYLKNIWETPIARGLHWILLQTQVYPECIHIAECLIVDDIETPVCFKKYLHMKKVGVPLCAIQIELKKNNLSYTEFMDTCNLKEHSIDTQRTPIVQLNRRLIMSTNLLLSVKLKHRKKRKKRKNTPTPTLPLSGNGYRPPDVNELLKLRSSLKRTHKVAEQTII